MQSTITIKTPIVRCADSETSRYALGGACVCKSPHGEGGVIAATDGRCLVALPIEADENLGAVIDEVSEIRGYVVAPASVLPKKISKKSPPKLILNGRAECDGKIADYEEGLFPRIGGVFEFAIDKAGAEEYGQRIAVTIDVSLLADIVAALQPASATRQSATLIIDPSGSGPIGVLPYADECEDLGGAGVLMPMEQEGNRENAEKARVRLLGEFSKRACKLNWALPDSLRSYRAKAAT